MLTADVTVLVKGLTLLAGVKMERGVGFCVRVVARGLLGGEGDWGCSCFGGLEGLPCFGDLVSSLEAVLSDFGRLADDCLEGVCC